MRTVKRIEIKQIDKPIKTRVYVSEVNETILENLTNRSSRPHVEYKKEITQKLIKLGRIKSSSDLGWSRTAGCSCGCSSGFILKNSTYGEEIYIELENV